VAIVLAVWIVVWATSRPPTYTIRCGYVNDVVGDYTYESTLPPGEATCPSAAAPTLRSQQDLVGTKWKLISIDGATSPVPRSRPITLEFIADRLGGWNGCNSYGARWTVRGPRLYVLGPVQATSMACDAKGEWAQTKLWKVLKGDPAISPETTNLKLSTPRGVLVFLPAGG
jgi:heat shock protein HslJ